MILNDSKKRKHRLRYLLIAIAVYILAFLCSTEETYAEADEFINVYLNNMPIMQNNSIIGMALRGIGWVIIKGLVMLASACETLYDTAFGFVDFTTSPTVEIFMEDFKPVLWVLCALSLLALGLILILKHEKKPDVGINIILMILCLTCGTLVFSELGSWTKSFKEGIMEAGTNTSPVYDVVDNNMVDLVDLGTRDGRYGSLKNLSYDSSGERRDYNNPGINEENFDQIDYNEVLNYKDDVFDWDDDSRTILKNKLVILDASNGEYTTTEVYNGFGWNSGDDADLANQFYYRYQFDFLTGIIELISIALVYFTMSYKCVRIAFELVIARLLSAFYSMELSGGEKIKRILIFIRDSYILLAITTICIKIYALLTDWIQDTVNVGLVQAIFSLFIAFAVIDGPNLVERLLGMDAGLKSSTARILAIGQAAKGGMHAVSGAAHKASGAFSSGEGKHTEREDNKPNIGDTFKGAADDDKGVNGAGTQENNREQQNAQTSETNNNGTSRSETNADEGFNTDFMNESSNENMDSGVYTSMNNEGQNPYGEGFTGASEMSNADKAESEYSTSFMNEGNAGDDFIGSNTEGASSARDAESGSRNINAENGNYGDDFDNEKQPRGSSAADHHFDPLNESDRKDAQNGRKPDLDDGVVNRFYHRPETDSRMFSRENDFMNHDDGGTGNRNNPVNNVKGGRVNGTTKDVNRDNGKHRKQ